MVDIFLLQIAAAAAAPLLGPTSPSIGIFWVSAHWPAHSRDFFFYRTRSQIENPRPNDGWRDHRPTDAVLAHSLWSVVSVYCLPMLVVAAAAVAPPVGIVVAVGGVGGVGGGGGRAPVPLAAAWWGNPPPVSLSARTGFF